MLKCNEMTARTRCRKLPFFRVGTPLPRLTYRDAGVDIDAGNELVQRIAPAVRRTRRPEVLSGLGGFAALATLPQGYREPVLVTGTDGVGTKLRLAIDHDRHDDIGQDLVAMCVNDVLVAGAEPFLFLDYYATGALDVDVAERVINGIAKGCEIAGCTLAGGETAEMPGFYPRGDYELAGFCVGVVEREAIITGNAIEVGDVLIGLASSGPHANGFSLIRRILDDQGGELADGLVDQLLAPTRIYVAAVTPSLRDATGLCHITGGGFVDNLPRMCARGDRSFAYGARVRRPPGRGDRPRFLEAAGRVRLPAAGGQCRGGRDAAHLQPRHRLRGMRPRERRFTPLADPSPTGRETACHRSHGAGRQFAGKRTTAGVEEGTALG